MSRLAARWVPVLLLAAASLVRADEPTAPKPERTDRYGDPLPDGAVARLGTCRFRTFSQHLALSPDGQRLAIFGGGEGIAILDAATGRVQRRLEGKNGTSAVLHFAPDSRRLAAVGENRIELFDLPGGKRIDELDTGGASRSLAFSADGSVLVIGPEERVGQAKKEPAVVWDYVAGKKQRCAVMTLQDDVNVALSADGKLLATWSKNRFREHSVDSIVQLWDAVTGKELRRLEVDGSRVFAAAWSPDGRTLAVSEPDGQYSTWDSATGRQLRRWAGRWGDVQLGQLLCFSPDGKLLAAAKSDGAVQMWDLTTGRRLVSAEGRGLLVGLAFQPGGGVLVAALDRQAIRLWEATSGEERTPIGGHVGSVGSLAFSPDGRHLFSVGLDGLRRWPIRAVVDGRWFRSGPADVRLRAVPPPLSIHFPSGPTETVSPDGRFVLTRWERYRGAALLDAVTGEDLLVIENHSSSAFSADCSRLAALTTDNRSEKERVVIWDTANGAVVRTFPAPTADETGSLALSADGRLLAVTHREVEERRPTGKIVLRVWETNTGKSVCRVESDGMQIGRLAFSADGALVAGTDGRTRVWLWDVTDGVLLREFELPKNSILRAVAFSPDGRTLAAAGVDREAGRTDIRVWEVASRRLRCEFRADQGIIEDLAFSPDGRLLASAGADTTILLWDVTAPPGLVVRPDTRLKPEELAALWADLDGDARTAHRALALLAGDPASAVAVVRREVKPAEGVVPSVKEIEQLLADLDDESFKVREQATAALRRAGRAVKPALRQALAADPPLEKRRRLQELLSALTETDLPPGLVRPLRATELLERIGTPEARQVLAVLAGGAAEAHLTLQAQVALRRLDGRTAPP
jgi:WD40 repeat protein